MTEFPTQKQENFARQIAETLEIDLPRERTKEAYSIFISQKINLFKREKQRYKEDYFDRQED